MKKLVAVLCAAVMTVGMAVNVFAAPSPSVSGVVTKVVSAVDADGNDAEIVLETVSDAEARSHFTEAEKNANGAWEDVKATAGNETVTFTVNSLSPFAFIVDANTAKNAGSTTSPATGEANTMVWVAIVAVAAAAGMVVTYRKKRA